MALNIVSEIDNKVKINNIIISVSDKKELDNFIRKIIIINPDVKIYSTGGTYNYISEIDNIEKEKNLIAISGYTKQPEMQGGLVKTLDFRIYVGLLSEKYNTHHKEDIARTESIEFDMVIVNLYPFADTIKNRSITFENARTNIDIGGPCMLRAAAKNFHRVASVCNPAQYDMLLKEMESNNAKLSIETRFKLSCAAFYHTAEYDTQISNYLSAINIADIKKCYKIH
jgi:phosphoribosylaminoimidazolecarboxamide formyltransferase/IMP cyclohydrolase